MNYRVIILSQAQADIERVTAWLAERSLNGAEAWRQALADALERLESQPELYGLAPESEYTLYEIRQILFRTRSGRYYRALFSILDDEVRILHIRGPNQRLLRFDELS